MTNSSTNSGTSSSPSSTPIFQPFAIDHANRFKFIPMNGKVTDAPANPTGLTATDISTTTITVSWTDNSTYADKEDGFEVYVKETSGSTYTHAGTVSTDVTTFTITNISGTPLSSGVSYDIYVSAYNSIGANSSSVLTQATTAASPAAPTSPSVASPTTTSMQFSWVDNSNNETGFKIERSTDNSTWSQIGTVGANVTSYSATGLSANTTYYFRTRAYNGVGDSAYTSSVSGLTAPAAPVVTVGTITSNSIALSWTATGATYTVEWSADGGSTWSSVGEYTTNTATSVTDGGLMANTGYDYRVRATNANGNSAYGTASATTLPSQYSASYLTIGGGGGGGTGGGGAGGYKSGTATLVIGNSYTITIGAGGAAGTNGSNSVFDSVTSTGGGKGGAFGAVGSSGGSGGGGGADYSVNRAGGSGTSGQGYAGGSTLHPGGMSPAGGGGGSGGAGQDTQSNNIAGAGGAGTASSITGSSVTRAGGGGGGVWDNGTAGAAGSGGGGAGAKINGTAGSGTANSGSGGGGMGYNGTRGAGGSGVVILSVPTANLGTYTGSPTVTTSGSNTILTYNASGTYVA